MKLLAIDPASYKCGVALFDNKVLVQTMTLVSKGATPLERRLDIMKQLSAVILSSEEVCSEEPLLLGRNNNFMQRLLGMIEFVSGGQVSFIHPMTLKKQLGGGKKDKLEMALAAGERLVTDTEKEILADAIAREAWDETDAVAVGLAHIMREGKTS